MNMETELTTHCERTLHTVDCLGASKTGPCGTANPKTHKLAYWEWTRKGAPPASRLILCVHGLTRSGRDFDALAAFLLERMEGVRIICPDVAGRGCSDWLADSGNYQIPFYVADMVQLLEHLKARAQADAAPITRLDWVGTSMGGLIALGYSALPAPPLPLAKLVLNDVGPVLDWAALQRIGAYLGQMPCFNSVQEGAAYLRSIAVGFGPHSEQEWLSLSAPMLRKLENGQYTLHYDPAIADAQHGITAESVAANSAVLWQVYDALAAQVLLLRGAQSDLLSAQTAQAMQARGPKAALVTFEGVGHAPTLVQRDQQEAVWRFLQQESAHS